MLSQVLHATVVKQLEIAQLLENLQQSKCHVSFVAVVIILSMIYASVFISSFNSRSSRRSVEYPNLYAYFGLHI